MSYSTSVIKSIQYGTVTLTNVVSATATITAVNVAKAVLIHLGTAYNSIGLDGGLTRITLTNSTTVTGSKTTDTGITVTNFVVVEFY